jgi:ATP-dependent Lon protease
MSITAYFSLLNCFQVSLGDCKIATSDKEKTLAAHRAGIKTFLLPLANAKDIPELPQRIRDELELIPVATMDEVLNIALRA